MNYFKSSHRNNTLLNEAKFKCYLCFFKIFKASKYTAVIKIISLNFFKAPITEKNVFKGIYHKHNILLAR